MKLAQLLSSWEKTQLENRRNWLFIAGLLGICLLMTFKVLRKETIVVLQPVTLSQEAWITENNASHSYKESWGLYLAQLLGNVTPCSLEFVKQRLQPLLAPAIYQEVLDALHLQAKQIQNNRITLRFEPRSVTYEASTDKVFVYGSAFEKGVSSKDERREERTYEYVIKIGHYGPLLTAINTYRGVPRTTDVLKKSSEKRAHATP